MKNRILLFLISAFLAWNFGPLLFDEVLAWLPTAFSILAFLMPTNVLGQGLVFYFKFAVALLLYALLLKVLVALFGFASPQARRYSTTKFLRRVQGAWAEVAIILFYLVVLPCVFLTITGWPEPEGPPPAWYEQVLSKGKELLGLDQAGATDRATIYAETLKNSWFTFLAGALFLWWATTKYIKRLVVPIHRAVLINFFEVGRFGEGGSARFAGLIEEWGLRYEEDK